MLYKNLTLSTCNHGEAGGMKEKKFLEKTIPGRGGSYLMGEAILSQSANGGGSYLMKESSPT